MGNIEGLLSIFHPFIELESVKSEKGTFLDGQSKFSDDSLFAFIEQQFSSTNKYLFCDDLGNEWADYIAVSDNSVSFFHAKAKDAQLSASVFHDIVSQALKNLGNLAPTDAELNKKAISLNSPFNLGGVSINRLRKGDNITNGINAYRRAQLLPNHKKQVYLVVNFISKRLFSNRLSQLRNTGKCTGMNEVVQLLWLLSSLVSSCIENGIEVYIICKP